MFEEVFFRGAIQQSFIRWINKPMLSIFLTSVLFSIVHFSIYLFLIRLVLGFALGLMFYETRNIWVNIIAHFINNTMVLLTMFLTKTDVSNSKADEMFRTSYDYWIAAASVFVLIFLFIRIRRSSQNNLMKIANLESQLMEKEKNNLFD
jgi:membrane protease YdiL (CAAX protease family)